MCQTKLCDRCVMKRNLSSWPQMCFRDYRPKSLAVYRRQFWGKRVLEKNVFLWRQRCVRDTPPCRWRCATDIPATDLWWRETCVRGSWRVFVTHHKVVGGVPQTFLWQICEEERRVFVTKDQVVCDMPNKALWWMCDEKKFEFVTTDVLSWLKTKVVAGVPQTVLWWMCDEKKYEFVAHDVCSWHTTKLLAVCRRQFCDECVMKRNMSSWLMMCVRDTRPSCWQCAADSCVINVWWKKMCVWWKEMWVRGSWRVFVTHHQVVGSSRCVMKRDVCLWLTTCVRDTPPSPGVVLQTPVRQSTHTQTHIHIRIRTRAPYTANQSL